MDTPTMDTRGHLADVTLLAEPVPGRAAMLSNGQHNEVQQGRRPSRKVSSAVSLGARGTWLFDWWALVAVVTVGD